MKRTAVFDLDGTLETPYFREEQADRVRMWIKGHPCGYKYDQLYAAISIEGQVYPHFILPGAFELLRWVYDHGFEIVFFSNAVAERNKALCPIMMERAFGKMDVPLYKVYSREDCLDVAHMYDETKRKRYEGLWYGNYKKRLVDIVGKVNLPNTLMIEDDNSYACKGEEQNFVYGMYGGCAANYLDRIEFSSHQGHDFHFPFYFCGMLKRIVERSERLGIELVDAARQVQYEDQGLTFPVNGDRLKDSSGSFVDPPYPPQHDYRIYHEGLMALRVYNPKLRFWGAEDGLHDWPKRKVKIGIAKGRYNTLTWEQDKALNAEIQVMFDESIDSPF